MKRFSVIHAALCASLFFGGEGLCTMPHPSPVEKEDLVEKFSLKDTDKIVLRFRAREDYFGSEQKPFDYEKTITDKKDIADILNGLRDISRVNGYIFAPEGELVLYSGDKEMLNAALLFFDRDPVLIIGEKWYMCYGKYRIAAAIYKYMPEEYKKKRQAMPRSQR